MALSTASICRWRRRLAAMTLIPALCFCLAEVVLRLAWAGYPTEFLVPVSGQMAVTTNPRFGWRFFPRNLSRTPVITRIPKPKPDGALRIFILGGSAALGTPEPAYSFGRILEVMLRDQFPDQPFEIVNAAMTAVNSHVVREIARDCADHQPDLFIVYTGNNEVVGPFGPGTVFMGYQRWRPLIRASLWSRTARIGQAIQMAAESRTRSVRLPDDWRGMELFLEQQVAADSPALDTVANHFRHNLKDICDAATRHGADTLLCTVAVNLEDCPPFASLHGTDHGIAERSQWDDAYSRGIAADSDGNHELALASYTHAAAIDDQFAELHFRIARAQQALGQTSLPAFRLARDLDALRFRTDRRLNQTIRDVATSYAAADIGLVDFARRLQAGDVPDSQRFYDHVHFTFDGNYDVARILYPEVIIRLPGLPPSASSEPLSREECARRLALTDPDRYRMARQLWHTTGRAPFTAQLDHHLRRETTFRTLQRLAAAMRPDSLDSAIATYQTAMAVTPNDLLLRGNFAQLLAECGDAAGAATHWQVLLDRLPGYTDAQVGLGASQLAQQNQIEARAMFDPALDHAHAPAEYANRIGEEFLAHGMPETAIAYFRRGIEWQPGLAALHSNLGSAYIHLDDPARARTHFAEAVRLNPRDPVFHNNLGVASFLDGSLDTAVEHLAQAIELDPFSVPTYDRLALVKIRQGDVDAAATLLARALELEPNDPALQDRYRQILQRQQSRQP